MRGPVQPVTGDYRSSGEFIAFLDADDEWLPNYLDTNLALFGQQDADVAAVVSGYFLYPSGESTETMWRQRGLRDGKHRVTAAWSPALLQSCLAYMTPCSTVARTSVVRRWGGYYDQHRCIYGEDAWLWLKVLLNEAVFVNMSPLVRVHSEASELSENNRGPREIEPFCSIPRLSRQCARAAANVAFQVFRGSAGTHSDGPKRVRRARKGENVAETISVRCAFAVLRVDCGGVGYNFVRRCVSAALATVLHMVQGHPVWGMCSEGRTAIGWEGEGIPATEDTPPHSSARF